MLAKGPETLTPYFTFFFILYKKVIGIMRRIIKGLFHKVWV